MHGHRETSVGLCFRRTERLGHRDRSHRDRSHREAGRCFPGPGPAPAALRPLRPPRVGLSTSVPAPSSGDLTAVPGAALGRALGRPGGLHFAEAAPLVCGAGGHRVGAAMHHPGVEAAGHGEGLEVTPQGHGQWQLVHQVHGRAGHHGAAAQVLQAEHCGGRGPGSAPAVPDARAARSPPRLPSLGLGPRSPRTVPTCGPGQGQRRPTLL